MQSYRYLSYLQLNIVEKSSYMAKSPVDILFLSDFIAIFAPPYH